MDLLSQRQAAKELHIAEKVVRDAVRNGDLPAYQFGERTIRVDRSEFYQWARTKRVPTWKDGNGKT